MEFKNKNLDEREIQVRARIQQRILIFLVIYMVVISRMVDYTILWSSTSDAVLMGVAAAVLMLSTGLIRHDIYPISKAAQKRLYCVYALIGVAGLGIGLYEHRAMGVPFFEQGRLSPSLVLLLMGAMFISIPIYYLHHNKRVVESEDKP